MTMVLLQAVDVAARIDEIMFGLSLFISALFYIEYRKYEIQAEKEEMLDNLLKD